MVNELRFAVTAEVVLFDRQGAQITSQTVAFAAHSQQTLMVGDLLRLANSAETVGSVEILPDPAKVVTVAIAAQISITGSGGSAGQHIEEEFLMVGAPGSGVLRSAGAALAGEPLAALKNTGTTAQTVTVSCMVEKGGHSVAGAACCWRVGPRPGMHELGQRDDEHHWGRAGSPGRARQSRSVWHLGDRQR